MIARCIGLFALLTLPHWALAASYESVPGLVAGRLKVDVTARTGSDVEPLVEGASFPLSALLVSVEISESGQPSSVEIRLAEPIRIEGSDGRVVVLSEIVAGVIDSRAGAIGTLRECSFRGVDSGVSFEFVGGTGSCGRFEITERGGGFDWEWLGLDETWSASWMLGATLYTLALGFVGPVGGALVVPEPGTAVLLATAALLGRCRRGSRQRGSAALD